MQHWQWRSQSIRWVPGREMEMERVKEKEKGKERGEED
jgi:hypothetical protein